MLADFDISRADIDLGQLEASWSEVLTRMRMIFDGWLKLLRTEPCHLTTTTPLTAFLDNDGSALVV